jgi:hypothetical protein
MVMLARGVAVLQGLAVIATCFLMDGMASAIVSMGNSKDPGVSLFTVLGTAVGIAFIVLAMTTPACRETALEGEEEAS